MTSSDGAPLQFTAAPIPIEQILWIVPLGALEIPGHIAPSDHVYFYFADPDHCPCNLENHPVSAMSDGQVLRGDRSADGSLTIRATSKIDYYYGHIRVRADLPDGARVRAGEQIGVSSGIGYGVDVGVINSDVNQGFLRPSRYAPETNNCDQPLHFFTQPLRDQLTALVKREGPDKDGRINFDRAGTVAGNWFLEGLAADRESSSGPGAWPKMLTFVYDNFKPTEVRVVIGGTIDVAGIYTIPATDPLPENITQANGATILHLLGFGPRLFDSRRLLVQLLNASTLRVEKFAVGTGDLIFDAGAQTYVR